MSHHYYIYYRIKPERAADCAAKAQELFGAVKEATGVSGRLLRKRGEPNLWMEIYENVEDEGNFEWELAEAVSRLGIQALLQDGTTRHIECFHE